MPSKRTVLEALSRDTLLALVDAFELESDDRRVKQNLIDALGASRRFNIRCPKCATLALGGSFVPTEVVG
jgi:hypothetical protein